MDQSEAKILIVDDKPENLRLLTAILKKAGYIVRQLRSGKRVMASVLDAPPDLILLDIMMPEMDGYEVCRGLKAEERTRDIPVIFISALGDVADKIKGFSVGGVDYITKPFREEEVLIRVKTHLSLRGMQNRLEEQNARLRHEIILREQAEKDRRGFQRRLQQARKTESLGRMAGAVAHHFNNLLQIVSGNLELIQEDLSAQSKAKKNLDSAEKAIHRATDLGRLMLTYVGQGANIGSRCDLSREVSRIVPLVEPAMPDNVRLEVELASDLPGVNIGPDDVRLIVANLVENAWESMDGKAGTIRAVTGKKSCDQAYLERADWVDEGCTPGEYMYIDITDDGCGMNTETIERMFDPFYTTKFTGRGLGLATVAGIVRAGGGAIVVSSEPGTGATVRVLFPTAGEPSPTGEKA